MATSKYAQALDSLALRMAAAGREPLGYRPNGQPIWPIFGAEDDPANPTPPPIDPPAPSEPGFPANTPLEQMSVEQREAYWKHQSRKHEDRAKAFKDLTPERLAELREKAEKHDALEQELMSDKDKAVADATKAAQDSADAKYRPLLAETAFRVAIGDRKTQDEVDDFIADLNLSRFLTDDGHVDTAKVLARVEQFAPAKGTSGPAPKGPTFTGHGSGSGGGSGTTGSGSDLYDRLHPKKSA